MLKVVVDSLQITGFVLVIMLVIEYFNVLTKGRFAQKLLKRKFGQYLFAVTVGAAPGCFGGFIVVAMYSHGLMTFGAVVGAMLAAIGDEGFVALAIMPKQALALMASLSALGLLTAFAVDAIFPNKTKKGHDGLGHGHSGECGDCEHLELHDHEDVKLLPSRKEFVKQWRSYTPIRGILSAATALIIFGLGAKLIGETEAAWLWITQIVVSAVAFIIVSTAPDHFLEEHLWKHVAKKHVPTIFAWTLIALTALHFLPGHDKIEAFAGANASVKWLILISAALVGLIPESGPHLVFVTLFANGTLPLSVLLANSIVQDGHGLLPMLAHSRRDFILVKLIKFIIALAIGGALMAFGS